MGDFDDEYDQQGRRVTKESLGIKKGDTMETMIDKTLRGMKVGDYITGDDASFLGEEAKTYIKTITRVDKTTFSIDGKSNWAGLEAFRDGAKTSIISLKSGIPIKGASGGAYKITITGLTKLATSFDVPSTTYIEANNSYIFRNDGYHKIPK